jgi:aryl-alcohol dehydrogenase-like predicted oxidoreductase
VQYRPLGRTGVRVSNLAFGAMTFGTGMGPITKVEDAATADELVHAALDTADAYAFGASEQLLGSALGSRRDEVLIATKLGFATSADPNSGGLSYRRVIDGAEASVRRLGTDRIDLLQIHKPDPRTPFDETARALDDLVHRGVVRYVGYCNLTSWQAAWAVTQQRERSQAAFVSAQMYYSLGGRGLEAEVAPMLSEFGLGCLVWSPLAAGYFTGKYAGSAAADDRRTTMPFPPVDEAVGSATVAVLRTVAAEHDCTVTQAALAWVLSREWVSSVILGVSRRSQLDENLGAADLVLSADAIVRLDAVSDPARHAPYWWPEIFDDPLSSEDIATRAN